MCTLYEKTNSPLNSESNESTPEHLQKAQATQKAMGNEKLFQLIAGYTELPLDSVSAS
jgi:hypothetical protein